jgi:hypothetical protein
MTSCFELPTLRIYRLKCSQAKAWRINLEMIKCLLKPKMLALPRCCATKGHLSGLMATKGSKMRLSAHNDKDKNKVAVVMMLG